MCKASVFDRLERLKRWCLRSSAGKADVLGKVEDRAMLRSTGWGRRLFCRSEVRPGSGWGWWGTKEAYQVTDMVGAGCGVDANGL